jgi:glycogen debranching enzyme
VTEPFAVEPEPLGGDTVTLVEGSRFCLSGPDGDIDPDATHGLFALDTRILSTWELRMAGTRLVPMRWFVSEPFHATFLQRATPRSGRADSTLLVRRERFLGAGMREDIVVDNLDPDPARVELVVRVGADFADLFRVKEGRVAPRRAGDEIELETNGPTNTIGLTYRSGGRSRGVRVRAADATVDGQTLRFDATVLGRSRWSTTIVVNPVVDGQETHTVVAAPVQRLAEWHERSPVVHSDDTQLVRTLERSRQDLGALRIFEPDHPDETVVAAGAPWFMALFGRDSLLSSYMALTVDPSLALGTLRTLARHQGARIDPVTEEQPGRILHEVRLGVDPWLEGGRTGAYYGTVDATPLFVMLLGELRRWGIDREEVDRLLPHADRALEWIERHGDRDGDGFVEYASTSPGGLLHQGWKDSFDGISFADGRMAEPPIALCEVQGYVYAAYLARAFFAEEAGDRAGFVRWRDRAARLRDAFNERFWLADRGWFAVGLDRDKRPIDALASNMGHCLWTGIVDPERAAAVAGRLLSPELFSGWGIRTLATTMGAYNPVSYHNGSVWPHDNAIIAGGLMRYGHVDEAQRVALAVLDTAAAYGGRLPELLCGFDRAEFPGPVPYPTSCSPQAWAAASPLHLLRVLLRCDPWIPRGLLWIDPALPSAMSRLRVDNVPLAGARVSVAVADGQVQLTGLPPGIEVIRRGREPITRAFGDGRESAV